MLNDVKSEISALQKTIDELTAHINIGSLLEQQAKLEKASQDNGLWNDPQKAQKVMQDLKMLNDRIGAFTSLKKESEELSSLVDISMDEADPSIETQIREELASLRQKVDKIEMSTLLGGEHDQSNAILSINAGAGGTDAQDWAQILLRMYSRWAEEKELKADIADVSYGEQAGIKSAVIFVRGPYAYGHLKSENGIHRLVRMSPFNADGKRHTSFAAVEVIPETDEDLSVDIRPEDLRVDTFRSSGPGGQNVQKVETAVRITHLPTGIVAACQTDKSQHRNRENAMKLLMSRLKDRLEQEHKQKIDDLRGEQKQIAWGSQIRSYVFAPYQLVKDHRTSYETGNVQKVIDGDIDGFISAFLKGSRRK